MKLLYFIVLTGLCMACHQPRVYRINGSLPGALDGYVVKLYNIDTYPDVLLDSTVIKDEKFQLEGTRTFEYPKYCRLVVDIQNIHIRMTGKLLVLFIINMLDVQHYQIRIL